VKCALTMRLDRLKNLLWSVTNTAVPFVWTPTPGLTGTVVVAVWPGITPFDVGALVLGGDVVVVVVLLGASVVVVVVVEVDRSPSPTARRTGNRSCAEWACTTAFPELHAANNPALASTPTIDAVTTNLLMELLLPLKKSR